MADMELYSAIKTPQVLELSGIGRRDVLEKINIEVKVELPGVGENVQEHTTVSPVYELVSDKSHETLGLLRNGPSRNVPK
jgi:choline dehydrogenase-like flavoprotein